MDLTSLEKQLNEKIKGGKLKLDEENTSCKALKDLSELLFGKEKEYITIDCGANAAKIVKLGETEYVEVTGKATTAILEQKDLELTVFFIEKKKKKKKLSKDEETTVEVTLLFMLKDTWKFSDSFKSLEGNDKIKQVTIKKPVFFALTSYEHKQGLPDKISGLAPPSTEKQLGKGLSFETSGDFESISNMVKGNKNNTEFEKIENLTFTGFINDTKAPVFNLESSLTTGKKPLEVGDYKMNNFGFGLEVFKVATYTGRVTDKPSDDAYSFLEIDNVFFGDFPKLENAKFSALLPDTEDSLTLDLYYEKDKAPSIGDLQKLVPNLDLGEKLPEKLKGILTNIYLGGLHLKVNTETKNLNLFSIQAISNTNIEIIDNPKLELDKLGISWNVLQPRGKSATYVDLISYFKFLESDMFLEIQLSKFSLYGGQTEKATPIPLPQLFKHYDLSSDNLPQADLSELFIFIEPDAKKYALGFDLATDWSIGKSGLQFAGLKFQLNYNGGSSNKFTGLLQTRFSFPTTDAETGKENGRFTISLEANNLEKSSTDAEYSLQRKTSVLWEDPAPTSGWKFIGEIKPVPKPKPKPKKAIALYDLMKAVRVNAPPKWTHSVFIEQLKVSFETKPQKFHFDITVNIPIGKDGSFEMKLTIDNKKDTSALNATEINGVITLKDGAEKYEFKVDFDNKKGKTFKASWNTETGPYLTMAAIFKFFGFKDVKVPDGVNLNLTSASFLYSLDEDGKKVVVIIAKAKAKSKEVGGGGAIYLTLEEEITPSKNEIHPSEPGPEPEPAKKQKIYYAGLGISPSIKKTINFTKIPLVGSKLAKYQNISLDQLAVNYASVTIDEAKAKILNDIIKKITDPPPSKPLELTKDKPTSNLPFIPEKGIDAKLGLAGMLHLGEKDKPLNLPLIKFKDTKPTIGSEEKTNIKWINIQKSFGPVSFEKIGFRYIDEELAVLINAGLSVGKLTIDLVGLTIKSKVKEFKPKFRLNGLGIAYQSDTLEIAGAFLNAPAKPGDFNYIGGAIIKASGFSLMSIGQYASTNNVPSMFLFAQVKGSFGGPPIFFVTGLAAGFGYNSKIRIPTIEEIPKFPLLTAKDEPQTPMAMIKELTQGTPEKPAWLSQKMGEKWLAVGIQFNSYKLIDSEVLVIAKFGESFTLALLGSSQAILPQKGKSYAKVKLDIRAVFQPQVGILQIDSRLSPGSFIVDPGCELRGGLAFYSWFGSNKHSGDYIFTIGGYNKLIYTKPVYYPEVDRLGFDWRLGKEMTISGEAYFAMTPKEIMAGYYMSADYSSGRLKAWFRLSLDAYIKYSPFSYDLAIVASLGASYRVGWGRLSKTFTIDISASIHLWGPPTGGIVKFRIWKLNIAVEFGDKLDNYRDVLENFYIKDEESFADLLPKSDAITKITPIKGLVPQGPAAGGNALTFGSATDKGLKEDPVKGDNWIVNPDNFKFSINAAIPLTEIHLNGTKRFQGDRFAITPLDKDKKGTSNGKAANIEGLTLITLMHDNDGEKPYNDFEIRSEKGKLPTALWTTKSSEGNKNGDTTQEHLTGIHFQPKPKSLKGFEYVPEDKEVLAKDDNRILPFTPSPNRVAEEVLSTKALPKKLSKTSKKKRQIQQQELSNLGISDGKDEMDDFLAFFNELPQHLQPMVVEG